MNKEHLKKAKNKYVFIVKYKEKSIPFFYIFLIFLLIAIFLLFVTVFYEDGNYTISFSDVIFFIIFISTFLLGIVSVIILVLDVLNTDRLEIYRDRIEKKSKYFKNSLLIGDKKIYFKDAYVYIDTDNKLIAIAKNFWSFNNGIFIILFLIPEDKREKLFKIFREVLEKNQYNFKFLKTKEEVYIDLEDK